MHIDVDSAVSSLTPSLRKRLIHTFRELKSKLVMAAMKRDLAMEVWKSLRVV